MISGIKQRILLCKECSKGRAGKAWHSLTWAACMVLQLYGRVAWRIGQCDLDSLVDMHTEQCTAAHMVS